MVHGVKNLTMAQCGTRARWTSAGLPIATDIGIGSARGAGLGWITSPGGSRRITMDAGLLSAAHGAGALVQSMRVRSMDLRSLGSSAADLDSESVLAAAGAAESAGSRSDSASRIIRGITLAEITTAT